MIPTEASAGERFKAVATERIVTLSHRGHLHNENGWITVDGRFIPDSWFTFDQLTKIDEPTDPSMPAPGEHWILCLGCCRFWIDVETPSPEAPHPDSCSCTCREGDPFYERWIEVTPAPYPAIPTTERTT